MPLKITVGADTKDCVRFEVTKNGVQKRGVRIEAWDGTAWKVVQTFAPPISLAATPKSTYAARNAASVVAVISETVTFVVTGGKAPFTYSTVQTSGPPASIYSPNSASSKFAMGLGPGSAEQAQFTCTVTDSIGQQASDFVHITFANISGA